MVKGGLKVQKGRKSKVRFIQTMPETSQFSPRGKPGRPDEVELKVDQYEAIKLADYQGYNQSEGAQIMGVSRPSFGRILRAGRKIVADAIINGKIIRIRIGNIQVGVRQKDIPSKSDIGIDNTSQEKEKNIREEILKYSPRKNKSNKSK